MFFFQSDQEELRILKEYSAQFSAYLQHSSILPINDAFDSYVDLEIQEQVNSNI